MMDTKKGLSILFLIILFLAAILPVIIFPAEFKQIKHDGVFVTVAVIVLFIFAALAIVAIDRVDKPGNTNALNWFTIIAGALLFIWVMGWCADYRSKVGEGIQYEYAQ